MTEFKHLIKEAETDPSTGQITNASTGGQVPLVELAIWNAERLQTLKGESYATLAGAIRHGLKRLIIPTVGGWVAADHNPADRAGENLGTARINTYNHDHTGGIVNPAVEAAYKNRTTTQELVTGEREMGSCLDPSCFVHPIHRTTTCGNCQPSGTYGTTGDIGTAFHRIVNAGLTNELKTPMLGMKGGRVVITQCRVLRKRAGAGKSGGSKFPAYRYGTTCPEKRGGCGRGICWGSSNECGSDNQVLFTIVESQKGRTLVGLDRRRDDFNEVVARLTEQVGGVAPVISPVPFSRA
jgi:hypothetical protein